MSISSDYGSYVSTYTATTGILGTFIGIYIVIMVLALAASVLMVVSQWIIFTKNNKPGWYSLIPFLNNWTLFELVGIQGWWCFVPGANVVFMYIANYKLPIQMGKSQGFAIMNILVPFVGYPMLAFSKNKTENTPDNVVKDLKENKAENNKFCTECGTEIKDANAFCPNCGNKVK